ncbi:MAG: carboxypeptidase regulatory-like domain-containing protein [Deltaproteobacteria bacterium]|nr:MAG: carboxypeptidase regulatory-like domain-containing protein [Deltaproteobacteria bacterium]
MSGTPRIAARSRWLLRGAVVLGSIALIAFAWPGESTAPLAGDLHGSAASLHRAGAAAPASSIAARSAAGSQRAALAGALRLEGQVIGADKQPVAGARVSINDGRAAVTEADGSFAFDGLAAGRYRVIAELGDRYAEDQDVALDDTSEPVTLTLVRGPTLVVHAVERDHRPIAGATVEVSSRKFVTGSDGAARIRGVDGDDEYVTVSAPGHVGVHERVITSDDPADTVEWTAVLDPGAEVTGTIVDQDGVPVPDAYLELESVGGGRNHSATADETGAWRVPGVGAGPYVARASSNRHIPTADQPVELDGAHATAGLVVRVQLGGEITGLVVDITGHPIADAQVSAAGGGDTTDASGRFTVRGLAPATYTVTANTRTLGAAHQDVVVARGRPAELTFVLVPSSLAGIVVDSRGEPVENARVIASSDALGVYDLVHSDASGHFDLGGLLPGRYQIVARRPDSAVDGPAVEATTADRRIRLVVSEPAGITGRVILDGAPVRYYGVAVGQDPGNLFLQPAPVRSLDGRFHQPDVPAGKLVVILLGPGFERRVVDVQPVAGTTTDLGDIVVTRGGRLRGRVIDAGGAGVAGATIRATGSGLSHDLTRLDATLRGECWATSDALGSFELAGLPSSLDGFEIEATHPAHGSSATRPLAPGATDVTLVLGPRP